MSWTIEAVIFDLGGTLVEYAGPYATWPHLETPGFQAAYEILRRKGVALPDFEAFREAGFALLPQRWRQATLGEQNLRLVDLLTATLLEHELSITEEAWLIEAAEEYQTAICGQAHMFAEAPLVLEHVKKQAYKIGLLSNTMFTGEAHKNDLRRFGLLDYFDALLFSADVSQWKPSPEPFWRVAEALAVAPEAAVYIGDDPASDVVGAQRAGMRTIHVRSSDRFPHPPGIVPEAQVERLEEVMAVLAAWQNKNIAPT